MNQWSIRKKNILNKNCEPHISHTALINPKAEVSGKVFIGENVSIGKSKILAKKNQNIHIGKESIIKDCVLLNTEENNLDSSEPEIKKLRDLFIGSNVFISSEVSVYGPTIISDRVFIGIGSTIINSKIGDGCIIEDQAIVKNIVVPPDTFIPSKSIVDSVQRLNEIILNNNQNNTCELYYLSKATS